MLREDGEQGNIAALSLVVDVANPMQLLIVFMHPQEKRVMFGQDPDAAALTKLLQSVDPDEDRQASILSLLTL